VQGGQFPEGSHKAGPAHWPPYVWQSASVMSAHPVPKLKQQAPFGGGVVVVVVVVVVEVDVVVVGQSAVRHFVPHPCQSPMHCQVWSQSNIVQPPL